MGGAAEDTATTHPKQQRQRFQNSVPVMPRPVVRHVRRESARVALVLNRTRVELRVLEQARLVGPPLDCGAALPGAVEADEDL